MGWAEPWESQLTRVGLGVNCLCSCRSALGLIPPSKAPGVLYRAGGTNHDKYVTYNYVHRAPTTGAFELVRSMGNGHFTINP